MNTSKLQTIPAKPWLTASLALLLLVAFAHPALAQGANLGGMPAPHPQPKSQLKSAAAPTGPGQVAQNDMMHGKDPSKDPQMKRIRQSGQQASNDTGSGLSGVIAGAFFSLIGKIYEYTVGALLKFLANNVQSSALSLPDLANNRVMSLFDRVSTIFKPLAVVALLYAGYLMMFKGAEYDSHYFTQHAMGKFGVVIAGVAFMPEIAHLFSGISTNIAHGVGAGASLQAIVGQNIESAAKPGNFLEGVAGLGLAIALLVLWVVSWMVKVGFILLFITAAPALFAWLFPGVSGLAGAWFRSFIACFAIPALYSLELMIGSWIVKSPQMLFGSSAKGGAEGLFSSLAIILVIYLLLKTPKQVLSWAFSSYSPGEGLGKRLAVSWLASKLP